LRVWMPLKSFGIGPFKINLEEKIKLSEFLNAELKKISGVNIVATPQLTIQAFNIGSSEKTKKLMGWINSQNRIFLSGCEINGIFSIRVCLLGYRLHFSEVNELLQLIKSGMKEI
jgi:aromatic-L-amino-acid/L-tryptophan decarboxylase